METDWKSVFFFLLGGVIAAAILAVAFLATMPVKIVEISPTPLEDPLEFYVAVLRESNYTVTEQDLRVNDYEKVSFKEFLWVLQAANKTECFFDRGGYHIFLQWRAAKLWIQIDGIYWEVRFD